MPVVDGSTALEVDETGLGHPESHEAQGAAALAQDPRPDMVVAGPIPQLEFRLDVVEGKKSKKSSLGKVSSKFKIKSGIRRYVERQKCENSIYLFAFYHLTCFSFVILARLLQPSRTFLSRNPLLFLRWLEK